MNLYESIRNYSESQMTELFRAINEILYDIDIEENKEAGKKALERIINYCTETAEDYGIILNTERD